MLALLHCAVQLCRDPTAPATAVLNVALYATILWLTRCCSPSICLVDWENRT